MDMRAIRFGIEIETIKRTREQTAAAIDSVIGGTIRHVGYPVSYDPWEVEDLRGRKWKVVADASLSSVPRHLQAEIISPVLTYEDIPQLPPPRELILDLDATNDRVHGMQEGRYFNDYYDDYIFLPLYVFCGKHLLAARARTRASS